VKLLRIMRVAAERKYKQGVVMTDTLKTYTLDSARLPKSTLVWNLYGADIDNLGRIGKPEECEMSSTTRNQLLVHIEPKQDSGIFRTSRDRQRNMYFNKNIDS